MIDADSPAGSWAAILQHCKYLTVADYGSHAFTRASFPHPPRGAATSAAAFDPGAAARFSIDLLHGETNA